MAGAWVLWARCDRVEGTQVGHVRCGAGPGAEPGRIGAPRASRYAGGVKHSEFAGAVEAVFGSYGASLRADLVLGALGGRTADEALAAGRPPPPVRDATCEAVDLDEAPPFP